MKPSNATIAVLVGVAVLICASCAKKEDCTSFRKQFISDIGWNNLQKSECLSASEKKTLADEHALYERASLVDLLEASTVGEVLQEATTKAGTVPVDEVLAEIAKTSPGLQQPTQAGSGPWIIPRAVLFLYAKDGAKQNKPSGTGFILKVPQSGDPNRFLRFLITARHLVDPIWAKCDPPTVHLSIRFNKKDGSGTALVPLDLKPKIGKVLYVPKDPHSDVAAILLRPQLFPSFGDYEILDVPFRVTATENDMKIVREGTTILTAGLDPDLPGEKANLPVFREGVVSRTNNELIKSIAPCALIPIEVHSELLSAPLNLGDSGAPIYVKNGRGGNQPVLVGVQSFVFEGKQLAGITPATDLVSLIKDISAEMKVQLDLYQGVKKD
ncbi:MAG TPA: hypothetical protein VJO35_08720 [Terriglobales bacterium]|nr:hypothetical protein [Terriglobales bacterium]